MTALRRRTPFILSVRGIKVHLVLSFFTAVCTELSREMTALRQRLYKLKNEEKAGVLNGEASRRL